MVFRTALLLIYEAATVKQVSLARRRNLAEFENALHHCVSGSVNQNIGGS